MAIYNNDMGFLEVRNDQKCHCGEGIGFVRVTLLLPGGTMHETENEVQEMTYLLRPTGANHIDARMISGDVVILMFLSQHCLRVRHKKMYSHFPAEIDTR